MGFSLYITVDENSRVSIIPFLCNKFINLLLFIYFLQSSLIDDSPQISLWKLVISGGWPFHGAVVKRCCCPIQLKGTRQICKHFYMQKYSKVLKFYGEKRSVCAQSLIFSQEASFYSGPPLLAKEHCSNFFFLSINQLGPSADKRK